MTRSLAGRRILVVEDEAIIAAMIEDILRELSVEVVGPAATVSQGLVLAEHETVDLALLDVNVRNEPIDPVAAVLRRRGIPLVFATGYGRSPAVVASASVVDKPFPKEKLVAALREALLRGPDTTERHSV